MGWMVTNPLNLRSRFMGSRGQCVGLIATRVPILGRCQPDDESARGATTSSAVGAFSRKHGLTHRANVRVRG